MTTPPARAATRWDIDIETENQLPFEQALAQTNLRRIELACLLEIATELLQLATGMRAVSMIAGIVGGLALLPIARAARRWPQPAQHAVTLACLVIGLGVKQWGVAERAAFGQPTSGYSLTLLSLTLLLVVGPRTMAWVIGLFFASYTTIIATAPIAPGARIESIVATAIVSGIALVAGRLIFVGRRNDHDQRLHIRAQAERLTIQNEELDQLMAITAHDLRSPLYGLRNLFDLADRRAEHEPMVARKALRDGIYSLDAMIALVTRLLHAHAADHQPLTRVIVGNVREHLAAAARRIGPQAEAAAVAIDLAGDGAPLWARFDSGAFGQILDNLLSNAVRFSPAGGSVTLAGTAAGDWVSVTVADSGPGVAPALRLTLFRKFGGAPGPSAAAKSGTGMGLFIAARLAARIDARLRFRDAPAGGSVFELSLRRLDPPDAPDQIGAASDA